MDTQKNMNSIEQQVELLIPILNKQQEWGTRRRGSCLTNHIFKTPPTNLLKMKNSSHLIHNTWPMNIYNHMDI